MMRIFFAGTPECALPALRSLAERYPIVGILTGLPAPVGRGKKTAESAVARAAMELKEKGIIPADTPVLMPEKLNAEFRAAVAALQPDLLVCFAYGKIFGAQTLALFPRGAVNIHPSLLPRWRGPSPVPAALAAGDAVTGVTVQYMAERMDAGDIILQKELPVEADDTTETLLARCAQLSASLIIEAVEQIQNGTVHPVPQDEHTASYCRLLQKDDGELCWQESAQCIDRKIRAYTPWPGAFTQWNGTALAILKAHPYTGSAVAEQHGEIGRVLGCDKREGILVQTGEGILAVQILQRETKKAMQWKDFLNGAAGFTGSYLGERREE